MVLCLSYFEEEGSQGGISIVDVRRIGFYDLFILWCFASTIWRRMEARAESLADVRRIGSYDLFILGCSASTIARRMAARAESLLLP